MKVVNLLYRPLEYNAGPNRKLIYKKVYTQTNSDRNAKQQSCKNTFTFIPLMFSCVALIISSSCLLMCTFFLLFSFGYLIVVDFFVHSINFAGHWLVGLLKCKSRQNIRFISVCLLWLLPWLNGYWELFGYIIWILRRPMFYLAKCDVRWASRLAKNKRHKFKFECEINFTFKKLFHIVVQMSVS